jgi:hypothetical protein
MANSDVVTRGPLRRRSEEAEESLGASSPIPSSSGVRPSASSITLPFGGWKKSASRVTDSQVALLVSAVLFVVGGWPLAMTEVPPYQDLPNHLATLTVIENLTRYPEFVFNGFFKTNAALFTWLYVVGKFTGLNLAARLFALLVVGLNAFVIPRFVLHFTQSRRHMLIAALFIWPMIHNWFVSMGMLDFALAVPLSLLLLIALDKQRALTLSDETKDSLDSASLRSLMRARQLNIALITALGLVTWYAHVFPILVVHMLVVIEALKPGKPWRERWASLRSMVLPLVPLTFLACISIAQHIQDTLSPMQFIMQNQKVLAGWELAYNLWAEWFWGYTNLSLSSMVPCFLLAIIAFGAMVTRARQRTKAPTFFSPWAILTIVLIYVFMPYKMTNWFHVNSRLIPFFWIGLLLYLPNKLPKARILAPLLVLSGLFYSVGMGVDYVRLDKEREEFTAGMEAVPEGARLLPLLFRHKSASDNTRNLLHMWGYYVVEKKTAAPLLFAHSRSFPVTYSTPPPVRFNHLVLEVMAPETTNPAAVCKAANRYDECHALFASTWSKFYTDATPRFDHLLLWDPTPDALAVVPPDYIKTFERGRLSIWARKDVLQQKTATAAAAASE